ncbi:hypothetical protein M422DRAFT_228407 [Sphaerobolus stellatus SS14]|uniref:Mitochondrial distribution and morphology protein 12 n=1 Tax=Sphaerobolus stellatus (strain SS14) TaxID=990650 RepID=A0A0C9VZ24_SPHS4|nr:hypothetical protein M422DRAFT_228407 [Sphaerobolus stellatus SS14]
MSIDLAWDALLSSSLSTTLVDLLNRQLSTTQRPSFIGPVTVTSFEFGAEVPDVEIVDVRDVYRDFLEDDEDDELEADHGGNNGKGSNDMGGEEDDFEWISRRTADLGLAEEAPRYHHLPPHVRYGRPGGPASEPISRRPSLSPLSMSVPGLGGVDDQPPSPLFAAPNIQLHFRITHQSNLRLTLTTSLLINYPSPSFMSLPIKLSVTGLIFTGEVVVAYEGRRKRIHLCILDDLDPYGPAGDRSNRQTPASTSTPGGKPLPIGVRLLPSIFIESEIGQADNHVLKNVTRVERFIQDVIRKTVEEELLFPNYHTIVLGESS